MKTFFYILTFILVLVAKDLHAQNSMKLNRGLRLGDEQLEVADYTKALTHYQTAYFSDSLNAEINYKIGLCYYNLKQKLVSQKYFERAVLKGEKAANYYLGNIYHFEWQFDKAIKAFDAYQQIKQDRAFTIVEVDWLKNKSIQAKQLMRSPSDAIIDNLGTKINSNYPDYCPLINADESILIFTSRRPGSTGNLKDAYGNYFEDIYCSKKIDGMWSEAQPISGHVNTSTHDAAVGLSADGEKLFIYRTSKDQLSGDLYLSPFDGKMWAKPELLSGEINTKDSWEPSACISNDGFTIYFTSDREGGYGGRDLYRIVRLPDSTWSKAVNLGATVNTAYDEDAPFIHPDNKTLYFSSQGHTNIGGFDIFKSTIDSAGKFSKPENLLFPINSVDDDIFFVVNANGKRAYYSSSSRKDFLGESDIYKIEIPSNGEHYGVLKGVVSLASKPQGAKITLIDVANGEIAASYTTNYRTGKYFLLTDVNKKYRLEIQAPYCKTITDEFVIENGFTEGEIIKNYNLIKE